MCCSVQFGSEQPARSPSVEPPKRNDSRGLGLHVCLGQSNVPLSLFKLRGSG